MFQGRFVVDKANVYRQRIPGKLCSAETETAYEETLLVWPEDLCLKNGMMWMESSEQLIKRNKEVGECEVFST